MTVTSLKAPGKQPGKPISSNLHAGQPTRREGITIQYWLKSSNHTLINVAMGAGVLAPTVSNVISGRRRSRRVEAEIARVLGKQDWNEVVLEARSEVTGKSKAAIIKDIERERTRKRKQADREFAAARKADNSKIDEWLDNLPPEQLEKLNRISFGR